MRSSWLRTGGALLWALTANAFVLPGSLSSENHTKKARDGELFERDTNPADFGWITKWAAIGDSFTAGIGSGNQLGAWLNDDWKCSRYSYSWPMIVNQALGSSVSTFDYVACSGDRTPQIYEQAQNLANGPYDVVMLTAGGNDLCLAAIIKACVFLPFSGNSACQNVINRAQENINTILKGNVKDVLVALNDQMSSDGIVVYNGYAPFFNTDDEDCANLNIQYWPIEAWWSWSYWTSSPLALSTGLRGQFNDLVSGINTAISSVIDEVNSDSSITYKAVFSDWSDWPGTTDGQFCSPNSQGVYPDSNQPGLMFFKRDTHVYPGYHDELKRRGLAGRSLDDGQIPGPLSAEEAMGIAQDKEDIVLPGTPSIYDSLLWNSPDPRAIARHELEQRDTPAAANCPGDGSPLEILGLGLPDSFLRNFHPNEIGHEAIAAFSLENLIWQRAQDLGTTDSICAVVDVFTCYGASGGSAYVAWNLLNQNYKSFCQGVQPQNGAVNWNYAKTYYSGTPSAVTFSVQLSGGASEYDESQCETAMDRIINSCDGNEPSNPMNWKFGGSYQLGSYTFEIAPQTNRPMPEFTRTSGDCQGWYKVFFSAYTIHGQGWADWDYGQQTLLPAARSCVGGGITSWKFSYYDNPADNNGWEWVATFNTPIWVNARCFENLKVQKAAGGYTMVYNSDFSKEQYSNFGCGGNDA